MRLICLCLGLIAVLSGAILAIHLIGGLFPNPIAVLFTNPDGSPCQKPCLFGVRPGKMTLDEALKVLDQHPLTQAMQVKASGRSVFLYSAEAWINLAFTEDKRIFAIELLYNVAPCPNCVPPPNVVPHTKVTTLELASAMQSAWPGNQILLFGSPPDIWGNFNAFNPNIKPPIVYSRCYVANSSCFYNLYQDHLRPTFREPIESVNVHRDTAN